MKRYIDTHTHIYDADFASDIEDVIYRAQNEGVFSCILPGIDMESHPRLIQLASDRPDFTYPATGLHPTSVNSEWEKELSFVTERAKEKRYVAIGEIGMDGYWSRDYIEEQSIVFEKQIELAASLSLPVIIHSRDATEEIFSVLEKTRHLGLEGVFHAFSGSPETYRRIRTYGNFLIGIGGVITYKNSKLPATLAEIPIEHLLLETDAPWLTPVPYRGKRNEPSFIKHIAAKIAEAKHCSIDEVAEVTTDNAIKLFKLKI
ncbi:MAG: TatD family hydrolase [Bacteroidales bacterium]|nr:TatD family hydrolase [Bacteroidales bacterium]